MDQGANCDVFFLPDEKFDFDVSLSPASSTGEDYEDEVFMGPVGHKEKCISVNVASRIEKTSGVRTSWSPLSGDQLDAICEEAQKLATQLQSSEHAQTEEDSENTDPNCVKNEFVLDSEAKLSILCDPPPTVLSPIKRQTFCVQDSPLKQLPPAVQSRLLKACSPKWSGKPGLRPTGRAQPKQHAPTRLSTSKSIASPVTAAAKTQARPALRGKTGIGVGVVLPSRPTAPTATRATTRSQTVKTRLQPPSKLSSGWMRSPNSSRNGSCEDLLSDSASVTSDVSDSSLNSSCLGKRSLAPLTKTVRTQSGVKPPGPESSRRLTDRRTTSSSSSSVSSFNSSISLSPAPAKGKRNSSLNQSLISVPSSVNKPTTQKHRRSVACKPSDASFSAAGRRSLSVQNRKPSQAEVPRLSRATPLKRPDASPVQNTPVKRVLERASSVPTSTSVRLQNGLKNKPKPQALVPPTPNGTLRGSLSPETTKMLKPKRLISVKSVDSLPQLLQKPALSALTPSGGSSSALQYKPRRPSALPTPRRSRLSGLPQATPISQIQPIRPLPNHNCAPTSLTPTEDSEAESVEVPQIQPFNLEEEEPVQAPPSTAQSDQSENTAPEALCLSQSETRKETEVQQTVETISKTQEILLLDLPTPALQPQEKLLIDLTNTPDLIRTKTCPSASELIDLSSPLIKWSPVSKKEKDAPLINLSF